MTSFTPMIRKVTFTALYILLFHIFSLPCITQATEAKKRDNNDAHSNAGWSAPIRFYQKTISRADGNRCSMHPSCSSYALDAYKKHNFFLAWILTCDRLLRCGHNETGLAPRVRVNGIVKAHDPLSANTFWWKKP